jgi:alanine racemase
VGLHLYGVGEKKLQPIAKWTAQVYQIRELAKGAAVGYGPLFTAKKKMRTAVLGVGYADGYRRSLSNRADVLINGRRCRVVGAVSMDLTTVDITGVPNVSEASRAVLMGEDGRDQITADELAKLSGCIPWEILTGISPRVPRRYLND